MAEHGVTFEIFYDGAWHPAPMLTRARAQYRRGTTSVGNDTDPGAGAATLDNSGPVLYAPRSVVSSLYGKIGQNTSGRLTADGDVRMSGEIASWKPQRPIKGSGYTPIELAGVLRRIGKGTDPIQSALTRANLALTPRAYWPLEGSGAALTTGTPPMVQVRPEPVTWDNASDLVGSLPLPLLVEADKTYSKTAPALASNAGGTSATEWSVSVWVKALSTDETTFNIINVLSWGGTPVGATRWRPWILGIALGTGVGSAVFGAYLDSPGVSWGRTGLDAFDGQWHHMLVTAKQNGTAVDVKIYIDGTVGSTVGSVASRTLVPVDTVEVMPDFGIKSEVPDPPYTVWAGGVGVYDRALTTTEITKIYVAGLAHFGESAADRFTRFCGEEGVTATVVGTAAESAPMGPQRPVPRLDVFDEIARTDDASIFETRSALGLTMRTGSSRLNQTPALTVSYLGQIQPGLVPVFGDTGLANDVTAKDAMTGASGRVVQATGPRNVQAPGTDPQGVGRYQTSIDVSMATAVQLVDRAGWRVSAGTFDGTWYAEVTVDLDAAPGLIAAVNAIDIGDVVAIAQLPVDEALDTVEGIVIGIAESLPPKRRLVTFYLIAGEPYRVGLLALTSGDTDPFVGHLEPDGSTTSGAIAAGASSFSVATPSGPLWTVDSDDFPFDVIVGGQRVTLSAISGGSSPQTFTVAAAGRKVVYPVASGAAVNVQQPIILAM